MSGKLAEADRCQHTAAPDCVLSFWLGAKHEEHRPVMSAKLGSTLRVVIRVEAGRLGACCSEVDSRSRGVGRSPAQLR